jgi:hypothetical protein
LANDFFRPDTQGMEGSAIEARSEGKTLL